MGESVQTIKINESNIINTKKPAVLKVKQEKVEANQLKSQYRKNVPTWLLL